METIFKFNPMAIVSTHTELMAYIMNEYRHLFDKMSIFIHNLNYAAKNQYNGPQKIGGFYSI